jgi:hypothetical protein
VSGGLLTILRSHPVAPQLSASLNIASSLLGPITDSPEFLHRFVPLTFRERHFADQDDSRHVLLRALHPNGFIDLRALYPNRPAITEEF